MSEFSDLMIENGFSDPEAFMNHLMAEAAYRSTFNNNYNGYDAYYEERYSDNYYEDDYEDDYY